MSIETVRKRCLNNNPNLDSGEFDKWVALELKRFNAAVKTNYNQQQTPALWNMIRKEGQTAAEAKNANFDKYIIQHAHDYLGFICDLYDYKPQD